MKQLKRHSALESVTNVAVGYGVAVGSEGKSFQNMVLEWAKR
jgi:hypothetical protein